MKVKFLKQPSPTQRSAADKTTTKSSIAQFSRDLEVVAGVEYGHLFSFARTDKYPTFDADLNDCCQAGSS